MPRLGTSKRRQFRLFLIKPSHYDDDGYVIQWLRSGIAIKRDPKAREYMDTALNPASDDEFDRLEIYKVTGAARAASEKAKREAAARAAALARALALAHPEGP